VGIFGDACDTQQPTLFAHDTYQAVRAGLEAYATDAAALGPAAWWLGRLLIFARYSLRSRNVRTAY